MMSCQVLVLVSVLVSVLISLGAGVVEPSSIVPEGLSKYCPGGDIVLRCDASSTGQIRWTAKRENAGVLPIVFFNSSQEDSIRRQDNHNISVVYYYNLGISYIMYYSAYSNYIFTCNDDKTFNVTILEEAPLPRNVLAVKSNNLITVTWLEPSQDPQAVSHYLIVIGGNNDPQVVNGTQFVFNVSVSDPERVFVMVVDICGQNSIQVEGTVSEIVPTTNPPETSTGGFTTQTEQPTATSCNSAGYIAGLVVLPVVALFVAIPLSVLITYCCLKNSLNNTVPEGADENIPSQDPKKVNQEKPSGEEQK